MRIRLPRTRPLSTVHSVVLSWLLAGCQASLDGKVNSQGDAELDGKSKNANAFADLDDPDFNDGDAEQAARIAALKAEGKLALMGARHDLHLTGEGTARCHCVRVDVGQPQKDSFSWDGGQPDIDPSEQAIIAFSSDGISCPEEGTGAAYRGYKSQGDDVIVLVENAGPGKPRTHGAIIPRPKPGGRLLMQPYLESVPYGKSEDGSSQQCDLTKSAGADLPPGIVAAEKVVAQSEDPTPPADDSSEPQANFARVDVRRKERVQPSFEDIEIPDEFKEDTSHSERDSFYLSAALGAAYGKLDFEDPLSSYSAAGLGVGFNLFVAGSPMPNLAVGASIGTVSLPAPELTGTTTLPSLTGITLNVVHVGGFADYYFMEDDNLHGLLELSYATMFVQGTSSFVTNAGGFSAGLGLGYDFWLSKHVSLGLLGHLSYAMLSDEGTDITALLPGLYLTGTFH